MDRQKRARRKVSKEQNVQLAHALAELPPVEGYGPLPVAVDLSQCLAVSAPTQFCLYVWCIFRPAGAPVRRSGKGAWSAEVIWTPGLVNSCQSLCASHSLLRIVSQEDEILRRAVALHEGKNWKKIGACQQWLNG